MRLSNVTKTSPVKTWNKENSKRKLKIDLSQSGLVNGKRRVSSSFVNYIQDAIKFLGEDIMPSLNDSTGSNKNIEEGAMKTRSRSRKAATCSKSSVNKGGIN